MTATIPIAAPGRWFATHRDAVQGVIERVCGEGQYILGPRVNEFERRFAEHCQVPHAVAMASGTDALALSLRAWGVAGGEVITSAHTAIATIAAIENAGATPVLADIDARYPTLSVDSVASLLTQRTRAIVPVHMFGHPADVPGLLELVRGTGIAVIEDCAQAHGARWGDRSVGSIGDAGAFSFYPTKSLGALGDAGAAVTRSDRLENSLRSLSQYGWDAQRVSHVSGYNSRMDSLQAAVLNLRLDTFEADFARRQSIARRYLDALQGQHHIEAPRLAPDTTHGFHQFVVQCDDHAALARHMAGAGVQCGRHYDLAVHAHPAYARLRRASSLANVDRLYARMLSVPIFSELSDAEVDLICDLLGSWTGP